jgi:hypothetical protein
VRGSLTTRAEIFPNASSSDPIARSQSYAVDDFFGAGIELRYAFPASNLSIGLGADMVRAMSTRALTSTNRRLVPVEDGLEAAALEATGYFLIPVAGPSVGIYIGGGVGAYWGRRVYRIGTVEAPSIDRKAGFGIHVLSGVGVHVTPWLTILGELKFRDLQFDSTNRFSSGRLTVGDAVINVGTDPFAARIHTSGMIVQLGTEVSF